VIPVITGVRLTGAAHRAELPLLVLGPAPGRSAIDLWSACAKHLTHAFDVVAWDLPGQGYNRAVTDERSSVDELAQGVLTMVTDIQEHRGDSGTPFVCAGVAVGGTVGLVLLRDHADRVSDAVDLGSDAGSVEGPVERPVQVAQLLRTRFLGETPGKEEAFRGGLDARSRAIAALAAGVTAGLAGGHQDEASHVQAALLHGLSSAEIEEVLRIARGVGERRD
jgi:pimeloyl-ACP methyl ester carboxylesterase